MRFFLIAVLLVALVLFIVRWQQPTPEQAQPLPAAPVATTQTGPAPTPKPTAPSEATLALAANQPTASPRTFALFTEPVTPAVYEVPSGALATWRQHAAHKPALVIFSKHPFLTPLGSENRDEISHFIRSAPAAELIRRGRLLVADPLLTSPQTVSAAIEAGLISELIFVEPTKNDAKQLTLPDVQQRAFNAGFLTESEALGLTLKDGIIRGKVRNIPFSYVHPGALPKLTKPVLLHIDLGYFDELFVNSIKTPIYPLLYKLIDAIRDADWPALAVTLSYSNQETEFSLEDRFMISTVADVLYHPALLEGNIPASWELRASALYALEMFAESTAQDLLAQAAEQSPDEPAALYDLCLSLLRQKQPAQAFAALDRAVALDAGYAMAYVPLAETAMAKGDWARADELWRNAATAFPDNPFIRISQADLLIRRERGREAQRLLRELQQLPWSASHHPGVPELLKEMSIAAAK